MVDPAITRYRLPQVPTPINDQDIANKAYVDGANVSELEFLQLKSAAGKMRNLTTFRSTVGAFFTITPPVGTTVVIYKIQVTNQGGTLASFQWDLVVDAVSIEEIKIHEPLATNVGQNYPMITKGIQLIGDGVKTIVMDLNSISAAEDVNCSMEAYDL